MEYFVYILTNHWRTVLYTGMSGDIEQRVFDHKTKSNKGFTNKFNCDRLVHFETYKCAAAAIAREKQIKKWRRVWKENLIEENNPNWDDLSEGWYDEKEIEEARKRKRR